MDGLCQMMRAVAPLLLLLISGAAAAPQFYAVVPDLPGPGPADEGFAIVSDEQFDLSGWIVTDDEGSWVAPASTMLTANEPLWVTGNQAAWQAHDGPPALLWDSSDLRLSNSGESIYLLDHNEVTADSFSWGPDGEIRTLSAGLVYTQISGSWVTPRMHRIGELGVLEQPTFYPTSVLGYASPDSTYEVLADAIEGAQERLTLHVYDLRHPELVERIISAATRGVEVHVLVDGNVVGADKADRDQTAWHLNDLRDAGATVRVAEGDIYRHHHLKVLVADETVAIQSENWGSSGVPTDSTSGNRGWGALIDSPELADWMWDLLADDRGRWDVEDAPPRPASPPLVYAPDHGRYQPSNALLVSNITQVVPIIAPELTAEDGFLELLIAGASNRILTQQLSMDLRETNALGWDKPDRFVAGLAAAAERGIDVRVQLAEPFAWDDTDNQEVANALVQAGAKARIWNHPELGTLHNKGWIIDDWVVVGSMNGHHASRSNNREVSIAIHSPELASYFASMFQSDWQADRLWIPSAPVPMLLVAIGLAGILARKCSAQYR